MCAPPHALGEHRKIAPNQFEYVAGTVSIMEEGTGPPRGYRPPPPPFDANPARAYAPLTLLSPFRERGESVVPRRPQFVRYARRRPMLSFAAAGNGHR